MIRRLRTLTADRRGAIIVELALVAPVLATMIIGVVDMSNAFSRKLALEQGAQRAIEMIMQTTNDKTVEGALKGEAVCQVNGMTGGVCNTAPITVTDVTVTYRKECTDSGGAVTSTSNIDPLIVDAVTCAVGPGSNFILVKVVDKYTPIFPWRFAAIDPDGTYHISATAGMRMS